jgi:hypothetical protein
MYLHGPLTVSDMCRKFWMTNCNVPSVELELASIAVVVVLMAVAVVIGVVGVVAVAAVDKFVVGILGS